MADFKYGRDSGRDRVTSRRARRLDHGSGAEWRRIIAAVALAAVAAVVIWAVPLTALARAYGALPKAANLGGDTLIYGQGGVEVADLHPSGSSRIPVPLNQIAPVMRQAVVAIEDRHFWSSASFDLARIAQAAFFDLVHHTTSEGASTIPEQLGKILYLQDNKSITYKVKEILFGQELTAKLSRSQVLDEYLNDVYFGAGATGIQAASLTYFGVPASRLNANQASLLAGLLPEPSYLDPFINLSAARQRQQLVVAAMQRQGELTSAEARAILAHAPPLAASGGSSVNLAPYFVDAVVGWLQNRYGSHYQALGLRVQTSLNVTLNQTAQQLVTQTVAAGAAQHMTDGALVAEDPRTGDVLAWVGGPGSGTPGGEIDMAGVPRQPGSEFKIFNYPTAIADRAITMTSPILDAPLTLPTGGPNGGPFTVVDYEGRYAGVVQAQVALGNSLNVPAIRVELKVGVPNVLATARNMGITTLTQPNSNYGDSLTLGAYPVPLWEMAQAGAAYATEGVLHPTTFVLQVANDQGQVIYRADPSPRRVLSTQVSFIMNTILSRNSNRLLAFGADTPLVVPGHTVAIKTGTSTDFRDNTALGWTPTLVVADWVGNANDSPMYGGGLNGITGCATLWHRFIVSALANTPNSWYPEPNGLTTKVIGGETDYYLAGSGPTTSVLGGGTVTPSPSLSPSPSPSSSPSSSPSPSPSPSQTSSPQPSPSTS
ncbi:MAG TPA: transglycosylase domain-containing protein [Candidatus Micrarchaeaceae archaeon]|nr:transglycosylase domain-containing protein [Candidatus Micrarchaeaceae archaeon]